MQISNNTKRVLAGATATAAGFTPVVATPVLADDGYTGFMLDVQGGYALGMYTDEVYGSSDASSKGFNNYDGGYYAALELSNYTTSQWDWSASAMFWDTSNSASLSDIDVLYDTNNSFGASKLDFELTKPLGAGNNRLGVGLAYLDMDAATDTFLAQDTGFADIAGDKGFQGIGPQVSVEGSMPINDKYTFMYGASAAAFYGTGSKGFDVEAFDSVVLDDDDDDVDFSFDGTENGWATHLGLNAAVGYDMSDNTQLSAGVRYDLFTSMVDDDLAFTDGLLFDDSIGVTTFYVGAAIKF